MAQRTVIFDTADNKLKYKVGVQLFDVPGLTFAEMLAKNPIANGEDIVDLKGLLFVMGGLIRLKSPNGTGWNITMDDTGNWVIAEDL